MESYQAATPLNKGFQAACTSNQGKKIDPTLYQSAVAEIMWLELTTRPGILHYVSKLTQWNQDPHTEHLSRIKHVIRYLPPTVDMKLHYSVANPYLDT